MKYAVLVIFAASCLVTDAMPRNSKERALDSLGTLGKALDRMGDLVQAEEPTEDRIGVIKSIVEGLKEKLAEPSEGSVRLRTEGGTYVTSISPWGRGNHNHHRKGRLEVYVSGRWGTVGANNDSLITEDSKGQGTSKIRVENWFGKRTLAMVVCRMLGSNWGGHVYGRTKAVPDQGQITGGTGFIALQNVVCIGSETNILDCPRQPPWENALDWSHEYDLTVDCPLHPSIALPSSDDAPTLI